MWGEKHGRAEQTLPSIEENDQFAQLAKEAGFSLLAGVAAQEAREHNKLERLCCHISRHAVPEKRISLISAGNIRYKPKTNYSHCSTHVVAPVHPALAASSPHFSQE